MTPVGTHLTGRPCGVSYRQRLSRCSHARTHHPLEIPRRAPVCVRGLHDAELDPIVELGGPHQLANVPRRERRNLVPVEQLEPALCALLAARARDRVVDDAVRVPVDRACAADGLAGRRRSRELSCDGRRWALVRLDVIGTAVCVERPAFGARAHRLKGQVLLDERGDGVQRLGADAVCAVDDERGGLRAAGLAGRQRRRNRGSRQPTMSLQNASAVFSR